MTLEGFECVIFWLHIIESPNLKGNETDDDVPPYKLGDALDHFIAMMDMNSCDFTKEEIIENIRNLAKKAPTRTPKHSNMGLWEGPGGIFSWSRFSTGLWIPFWLVLVPFGEPWGPFRCVVYTMLLKGVDQNGGF